MFEIPDDDDLFSEENLGDILHEVNNSYPGPDRQKQTSSFSTAANVSDALNKVKPFGGSHMVTAEGQAEHTGSPRMKRMRVLTDVNCPSSTSNTSATEKMRMNEAAVCERNADASSSTIIPLTACKTPNAVQSEASVSSTGSRRRSQRKFPGPAGILPIAKPSDLSSVLKKSPETNSTPHVVSEQAGSKAEEEISSSQSGGEPFGGTAWRSLVADLQPGASDVLTKFSVRAMLHKASRRLLPKGKVPLMLGVLESMDFQGTDASVVLKDPTGEMRGTVHREAVRDFSLDLQTGAAMVLRQVSVISPSSRTHYLNITGSNIVAIYPPHHHQAPILQPSSLLEHSNTQALLKSCVQAADLELLEAANTAKQASLTRLRQQGSPQALPGSSVRSPAPSPGLFSTTPYRGARGAVSAPFSPHRPRQPSSVTPTPVGTGRFTFAKTASSVSTQMRGPTPGNTVGRCGDKSVSGLGGTSSSFCEGGGIPNSRISQNQMLGIPCQSGSVGQTVQRSASGFQNKSFINNQSSNCRLQPPTPNSSLSASSTTQAGPQTVRNHASATPSSFGQSSPVCSSDTIPNASKTASTKVSDSSVQGNYIQPPSKWSFNRKTCDSFTQPGGVTPRGEPHSQRLQCRNPAAPAVNCGQSEVSKRCAGVSQSSATVSAASALSRPTGLEAPSGVKGVNTMWDEELDDDILSQLSDDF